MWAVKESQNLSDDLSIYTSILKEIVVSNITKQKRQPNKQQNENQEGLQNWRGIVYEWVKISNIDYNKIESIWHHC